MAWAEVDGRHRLVVRPGDRILLTGPNGSGKTSILRALAGLQPWIDVVARLDGDDAAQLSAARLSKRVAAVWQAPRDNLVGLTVGGEFAMRGMAVASAWGPREHREVALLSAGETRRLALQMAAGAPAPRLVLLDEPMEGLDADGEASVRRLIEASEACVFTDHTGLLGDLATATVELAAGTPPRPLPPLARPPLPTVPPTVPPTASGATIDVPAQELPERGVHLPSLRLTAGLHAVTGPNAAGKSTLLETLAGLHGGPVINARLLTARASDHLVRARVEEELAAAVPWIVDLLVPQGLLGRHPLSLSGGEAQRVALAKTLSSDAQVLLLDEPEAHLDDEARHAFWHVVGRLVTDGRILVVATHDPEIVQHAHHRTHLEAP